MSLQTMRQDLLALDRASTRVRDADGHLHVRRTPISKACVNDYLGREIPGWQALGLEAGRRYALLRDPEELARAADTFNNKPLLFDHNPVSADEHDHDRTVGSVSNPSFEHPYLYADLACWSGPAIRLIEDGSQKELSSAYRYTPDMTPGTFQGVRFDGVMRDISANHVALVKKGRAGPDVVVGDSAIGSIIMAKTALTRAAAHTQGALSMYLRPKLAQDAKVDIGPLVADLTKKNFKQRRPVLALGLIGATHGKLAKDSDLGDVEEMLDRVEEAVEDLADTVEDVPEAPAAAPEPDAEDASGGEVVAFLEGKLSPEDLEQVKAMLSGSSSMPAADRVPPPAQDHALPKAPDMSKFVTRQAMDSAIQRAAEAATAAATEHQSRLRAAERFVRPWVGDLPAMDSEEQIHRAACDVLGIKHTGVHASALPVLIERTPKPGEQAPRPARRTVTQDSAAAAEVAQAFPHMHRLSA
ncbi:DUF2213 domain-containing protein [Methylobacterium frigidaeris]|uniref:DUF2213 domain-containing protein n=3 Tax=Methylobacterium frigidaeris TaxID=2038277 RepID=A0AA37HD42_9HYPH|nr:DUF2213 domain-containing protein [Methylobacterium frigidaeris]GJD63762.1 hypothetical protein MPEAHAMD_3933 [Methylobacterium frigidaeris]